MQQVLAAATRLFILTITAFTAYAGEPETAYDPVTQDIPKIDTTSPPGIVTLQIPSGDGLMNALIYTANGPGPHPTLIFFNGFPGNEKDLDLLQALRRAGFNSVFFHYRGSWGSSGTYSMNGVIDDALTAIKHMRTLGQEGKHKIDPSAVGILGHSLGGFTAIAAGLEDTAVTCTISITPADMYPRTQRRLESGIDLSDQRLKNTIPGLTNYSLFDLIEQSRVDEDRLHLAPRMAGFKGRALLIVSGSKDQAVTLEDQMPLVEGARTGGAEPFDHIVLEGDHVFSEIRITFMQAVTRWASKHCRT